ncbi:hypothetical protein Taro_025495 [Colocasia esculenta]|uniref:ERAD-associated E3 ubiquitin-protein ligase component HRD3A n=1 Tax=Colocasia esculenta TaxID=4460 RepID=A0A843V910_COLES|nr:hypothetical protein [Colocasia esculenta]
MSRRSPARRLFRRQPGTPFFLLFIFLLLFLPAVSAATRPFVLVITKDDLKDAAAAASEGGVPSDDSPEWDQFGDPDSKCDFISRTGCRPVEVHGLFHVALRSSLIPLTSSSSLCQQCNGLEKYNWDSHASSIYKLSDVVGMITLFRGVADGSLKILSSQAKEYFEKAANNEEPGGHYNLGVLYLKGIGVERDVALACRYFLAAANEGQPKALYQVAKMFQRGIGLKKNLVMLLVLGVVGEINASIVMSYAEEFVKALLLYKIVAERGPWSSLSRWAVESYVKGDVGKALILYLRMAELGYEVAQSNAAWILDKYGEHSMCMGESGFCTDVERHLRAHSLWWQASEQGNEHAALLIGDAYYYGRGTEKDYERAAEAYRHAHHQSNAQAMFNLGYMYEHGLGLPFDLHLAKRYYDQALENDPAAKLPVTLALASLWIRKNYDDSFLVSILSFLFSIKPVFSSLGHCVNMIDNLPHIFPRVEAWVEEVLMDEGNATILTLFVCLLTVLYLRERQRRQVVIPEQADVEPN